MHGSRPLLRGGILAVLLAVFAVRLLALPGFMPQAAADGTITLAICSETGNAPKTMDIPVQRKAQEQDDGGQGHCPFTGAGHLAFGANPPALADQAAEPQLPAQTPVTPLVVGVHAPLPPSTGPPALTA